MVAFALGYAVPGRPRWRPALVGTVALLLAVQTSYLAAVLVLGADPSTLADANAQRGLAFAVAAGIVFATAGAWARDGVGSRACLGTAFAPAALFAEAVLDAHRAMTADSARYDDLIQTAVILVALGLVAAALIGRDPRSRLGGLVLSLPLTVVGAAAAAVLGLA